MRTDTGMNMTAGEVIAALKGVDPDTVVHVRVGVKHHRGDKFVPVIDYVACVWTASCGAAAIETRGYRNEVGRIEERGGRMVGI